MLACRLGKGSRGGGGGEGGGVVSGGECGRGIMRQVFFQREGCGGGGGLGKYFKKVVADCRLTIHWNVCNKFQ